MYFLRICDKTQNQQGKHWKLYQDMEIIQHILEQSDLQSFFMLKWFTGLVYFEYLLIIFTLNFTKFYGCSGAYKNIFRL
jgi:hypothetical protein